MPTEKKQHELNLVDRDVPNIQAFMDLIQEQMSARRVAVWPTTLNLSHEFREKLELVSRFREIPMNHLMEVAAKPMIDRLYAELENDFRASTRGAPK